MKKLISLFAALFLLFTACLAEAPAPDAPVLSPLQEALLTLGHMDAPADILFSGTPEPVSGKVELLLTEVGLQDVMLYGGAVIAPTDPENTLLMPGNWWADEDEPYQDGRTWLQVAADENKTLYAVYVYPVALDASPVYILDCCTLVDGSLVVLGMGEATADVLTTFDLTVQIYEVAADGKYTAVTNVLIPVVLEGNLLEEAAAPAA